MKTLHVNQRWLILAVLLLGAVLRIFGLTLTPPGFYFDEASESYDAFSLWHTGRDHHGARLPIALQSFNDYRMALFSYSMAPLVGLGGLSVFTARLTSAFWGLLVLAATYWVGCELFNRPTALIATLLLAISPWHVQFSRIAIETNPGALAATLTVGMFYRWRRTAQGHWLIGAAAAAALGLYTYAVMKLTLPLIVGALALLYWRTLVQHPQHVLLAVLVGLIIAAPVVVATLQHPEHLQDHYQQIAVFQPGRPLGDALREVLRNVVANLSPGYLFIKGSPDLLFHPPGVGELYPAQALLIIISLIWSLRHREWRIPFSITLIWLSAGILPAALTVHRLGSGHAQRTLPVVVPWQLLSGFGLAGLLKLSKAQQISSKQWQYSSIMLVILSISMWLGLDSIQHFIYYFTQYPTDAAWHFHAGMEDLITTLDSLDDNYEVVFFSCHFNDLPYIDILFFSQYDPQQLQQDLPVTDIAHPDRVTRLGKYYFVCETEALWESGLPGLYVIPAYQQPNLTPLATSTGPDGQPMAKFIGRKTLRGKLVQWVNQCTMPLPLPALPYHAAQQIAPGKRDLAYPCATSWIYPQGGQTPGIYVLQHDLHISDTVHSNPASLQKAQAIGRLQIQVSPHILPFRLYAHVQAPTLPVGESVIANPVAQLPTSDSPRQLSPLSLNGPLTFLGTQSYAMQHKFIVDTWWRVSDGPITRNFSIMAHLLTFEGDMLGIADGLDIPPIAMQSGDVIVQRHTFNQTKLSSPAWLRTGAYWLDTPEPQRWTTLENPGADAIFVEIMSTATNQEFP